MKLKTWLRSLLFLNLVLVMPAMMTTAQTRGSLTVFGDVKVDESKAAGNKLGSLTVVLCTPACATIVGRNAVAPGGRYRFNNIPSGEYDLVVEVYGAEISRTRIFVTGRAGGDFQQDLEFAWRPTGTTSTKAVTVSAADLYQRSPANQSLFERAQNAIDAKKFDMAVTFLMQIVESDKQDFQSWTELGTSYLLLDKKEEAEKAYEHALEARPTFNLALLALGRLRVDEKKYDAAIPPLTALLEINPKSADGNYLLGEAYLQIKKGSKAVPYLNEAANLGRPEAHLRLAALYDAVGMKDKAAVEYDEFLKKKPDYPDRKKLQKYIADNKKP
jgi:Flp pilus assembly protein TadD